MESEADAGDAAAGDLVAGEGLAIFVGEVKDREAEAMACPSQPVRLGSLLQPNSASPGKAQASSLFLVQIRAQRAPRHRSSVSRI